jgi:AcrR family transcriptional regulator
MSAPIAEDLVTPGSKPIKPTDARMRLLDAAVDVIRGQGYAATTIDEICLRAGLTKGGFFHHFRSKEDLAVAAAAHFAECAETLFESAAFRKLDDPRERVLGYVDFRKAILRGDLPQFTCLLGTMVQKAYETHPVIRAACDRYMANMPPSWGRTSRRRRRFTRPMRNGLRTAWRSSRNRSSRAPSSSPGRSMQRRSPPTA